MPKVTLEFNTPEEQEELDTTMKAMDYRIAISEFYSSSLRKRTKYNSDNLSEKEIQLLDKLTTELINILEDRGIEQFL